MSFLSTSQVNYNSRIERAEELLSRHAFAKEALVFYLAVARFQKQFYEELSKIWGKHPRVRADGSLRAQLNLPILVGPFGEFLSVVKSHGPSPVASEAHRLAQGAETMWAQVLEEFWNDGLMQGTENGDEDPLVEFVVRAFLLPYAEFNASGMQPPVLPITVCRCPRCNSLPLLGVLRPEGDGGKRYLQCSFCSQEWEFRRIFCAHCGEDAEQKLPVYIAEQFPHIRVECCETCKHYLRTVDLTRDGNAVPFVDDLAVIPLTLWANENGYKRIQSNLFGT